jgi:hypothetical protein
MMAIVIIGGDCIVFVRLLLGGHNFDFVLSYMSIDRKSFMIALVPGVAIFVLSLIGGPRKRPPH